MTTIKSYFNYKNCLNSVSLKVINPITCKGGLVSLAVQLVGKLRGSSWTWSTLHQSSSALQFPIKRGNFQNNLKLLTSNQLWFVMCLSFWNYYVFGAKRYIWKVCYLKNKCQFFLVVLLFPLHSFLNAQCTNWWCE